MNNISKLQEYSEKELLLSENLRLRIENEALKLEIERLNELHWFW